MKASLFAPLLHMDASLRLLAVRTAAPQNILLPKLLLDSYIGGLISAAVGNAAPNRWRAGVGAPVAGLGANGDLYLNTATGDVYGPKVLGSWGAAVANFEGTPGNAGTAGSRWIVGTGTPAPGVGTSGDLYLDASVSLVYGPKNSGVWGTPTANLRGASGPTGNTWRMNAGAPTVGEGTDGDLYLNVTTGDVYGPKTGGVWGSISGSLHGGDGSNGSIWLSGTVAPLNTTGNNGDFYINTATFDFYGPKTGGVWAGIVGNLGGADGIDGALWFVDAGVPDPGVGNDNDMYFDTATGDVYGPKTAGAWGGSIASIHGTNGTNGTGFLTGTGVPAGGTGADGDTYFDLATGDVYGPKTGGSWGAIVGTVNGTNGTNGAVWLTGTTIPAVGLGVDGDLYLRTTTGDVYGPKAGGVWGVVTVNLTGTAGSHGTIWLTDTIIPGAGTGVDGDMYLNTVTGDVYGPKTAGVWGGAVINLTGPTGAVGAHFLTGSGVPAGGTGADGDMYINTANGTLYGPKASGAWGAAVANLTGPQGTDGAHWLVGTGVPAGGLGVNGDLYLNTATGDLYGPKAAGAWGSVTGNVNGTNGENGSSLLTGSGVPAGGLGVDGDTYINLANGDVYGPKASGAWGSVTATINGTNGTNGAGWLTGSGVPGGGTGNDGDFYLNTVTNDFYGPKASGAWGSITGNLEGDPGMNGTNGSSWLTGTTAPGSGLGVDGDLYFRTTNGDVYGPKASGAWGSVVTNLTGTPGTAGAAGSVILTGSGVPSDGSGANGDLYIRTNGDVYGPKASGTWGAVAFSIIGPTGDLSNRVINGGGVATIMKISQASYDALSPPDANTLYIIE